MRPTVTAKWRNLLLLALAEGLAISLWFSASAALPQIAAEWSLDGAARSWMTMSVQVGFVAGALVSALVNLADRVPARYLLAGSALAGAAFNAAIVLPGMTPGIAVVLRFATGFMLAGVYPPGMKLVATWCREDRGLGIGVLVGALTLGKAFPHLLNGLTLFGDDGMPPWRALLVAASVTAAAGGGIAAIFVRAGPWLATTAPFDWRVAGRTLTHAPTRLANLGYLGHMWELYAMWAWVPICLLASYEAAGMNLAHARFAGFATIAVGAAGSVLAGRLADRLGRTRVAGFSLALSGCCALVAAMAFRSPLLLTAICIAWGFAVVADSAQFSAAVSELTDPRYVGTALTLQTCLGFLLTLVTLRLVPPLVERVGWAWTFPLLALGPVVGIWAMARLRSHPESVKMASGNR